MFSQHKFLLLLGLVFLLPACTAPPSISPTTAILSPAAVLPTPTASVTPKALTTNTNTPRAPTQTIVPAPTAVSTQTDSPVALAFPFDPSITNPGTVWVGDIIPSRTTFVVRTNGEAEPLNVSVASVSPDGKYAIFVEPVLGYARGLNIANLQNRSVRLVPKMDKEFFMLLDAPNFVFSPGGDQFVALTLRGNQPGWTLLSIDPDTGTQSILLTDAAFQKTAARLRDDETLVPLAWKPNNVLLLRSIRPNTDANFGILVWNRNKNTWQRIKTVDVPLFNALAWSPAERQLLFMGRGLDVSSGKTGLVLRVAELHSNTFRQIAVETDGLISDVQWTPSGIYYLASDGQTTWLKRIDPTRQNAEPELLGMMDGELTKILHIWE